jgi:hypothetical protein
MVRNHSLIPPPHSNSGRSNDTKTIIFFSEKFTATFDVDIQGKKEQTSKQNRVIINANDI